MPILALDPCECKPPARLVSAGVSSGSGWVLASLQTDDDDELLLLGIVRIRVEIALLDVRAAD